MHSRSSSNARLRQPSNGPHAEAGAISLRRRADIGCACFNLFIGFVEISDLVAALFVRRCPALRHKRAPVCLVMLKRVSALNAMARNPAGPDGLGGGRHKGRGGRRERSILPPAPASPAARLSKRSPKADAERAKRAGRSAASQSATKAAGLLRRDRALIRNSRYSASAFESAMMPPPISSRLSWPSIVSVRIATLKSVDPSGEKTPLSIPIDSTWPFSSSLMISTGRNFGAPVTEPQGKSARTRSPGARLSRNFFPANGSERCACRQPGINGQRKRPNQRSGTLGRAGLSRDSEGSGA